MRRTAATILVLVVTVSLASCSDLLPPEIATTSAPAGTTTATGTGTNPKQGGGKLVVYSPDSEGLINAIVPLSGEKCGVDVEMIQAGTGELVERIRSEKKDLYADVLFDGSWSLAYDNKGLQEPYIPVSDNSAMGTYKNICDFITDNVLDGSRLVVSTGLIGDIKVDSYADLLNPKLKGKVTIYNPASSSSAFAQLANILPATGGHGDDGTWKFVEDLFTNIDSKICESSSVVYKGVADDKYVVVSSYEDSCTQLVRDGAPIKVAYPTEGAMYLSTSITIIKGAKNMDSAKLFMDFIVSEEVQNIWGTTLTNCPVLKGAETSDLMTPISETHVIEEDIPYVSEHKKDLVNKYTDIFTSIESNKQSTNLYGSCGTAAVSVIKRFGG